MKPPYLPIKDLDLHDSENKAPGTESLKKIFHEKTEDGGNFNTELDRGNTEQLEDAVDEDFTASSTANLNYKKVDLGEELLGRVLARFEDIVESLERARRAEHAFKAFKKRAQRTENTSDRVSCSVDSEKCVDDGLIPPPVEGDIYTGHSILKSGDNRNENQGRGISWAAGVKPPTSEQIVLDPRVEVIMREKSLLVLQRTPEERRMRKIRMHRIRLLHLSYRQVNNSNISGQRKIVSRIPVPVKTNRTPGTATSEGVRPRQWRTPTRIPVATERKAIEQNAVNKYGSNTAKTVKPHNSIVNVFQPSINELSKGPDRGIRWPERITDLYSVSAKAYYIEQFQRTDLFRQRHKKRLVGDASWEKSLTPFQHWVVGHVGTDELTVIFRPAIRPRPNTAKAKVTCWR